MIFHYRSLIIDGVGWELTRRRKNNILRNKIVLENLGHQFLEKKGHTFFSLVLNSAPNHSIGQSFYWKILF
jgi:hypothetical protein